MQDKTRRSYVLHNRMQAADNSRWLLINRLLEP